MTSRDPETQTPPTLPTSGGSYVADPKTGELTRNPDEPEPEAAPEAAAPSPSEIAAAEDSPAPSTTIRKGAK